MDFNALIQPAVELVILGLVALAFIELRRAMPVLVAAWERNVDRKTSDMIAGAVREAILYAEQIGLSTAIKLKGEQKFQLAVDHAQAELDRLGIPVDLHILEAKIEAKIAEELNAGKVFKWETIVSTPAPTPPGFVPPVPMPQGLTPGSISGTAPLKLPR